MGFNRRKMEDQRQQTKRPPSGALGHVWTAPWQELF
jgi:hypothetical protein